MKDLAVSDFQPSVYARSGRGDDCHQLPPSSEEVQMLVKEIHCVR